MRTVLSSLALALALSGCAAPRQPQTAHTAPLAHPVPITLWVNEGDKEHALPQGEVHDHPCGLTITVNALHMPPDSAAVESDFVIEFDASGKELQHWRIPVDTQVLAIRGKLLSINLPNPSSPLWLDEQGRFHQKGVQDSNPESINCPAPVLERFQNSVYLHCLRYTDGQTRRPRLLALEGPCT